MAVYASSVLGNSQRLDGGAMFGNAPRAMWEKWIQPDDKSRIPLACRTLLIETKQYKILFETGIGAFFEPKLAERFGIVEREHCLLKNLGHLGLSDRDITHVVLSHLHFDHAGGLLPAYKEGQAQDDLPLLFPNATYVVGEDAFHRSSHPHSRDRASFIPGLDKRLTESGRLQLIKEHERLQLDDVEISFYFSNGHTPGHMHSIVNYNDKKIFFAGDLIPGLAWIHLPITMGYDRFPELVIDEKQMVYQRGQQEGWLYFYTHDNSVAISGIELVDRRYLPVNPRLDRDFVRVEL